MYTLVSLDAPVRIAPADAFLAVEDPVFIVTAYDVLSIIGWHDKLDIFKASDSPYLNSEEFFSDLFKHIPNLNGGGEYDKNLYQWIRYAYFNNIPVVIYDPSSINLIRTESSSNISNLFDLNSCYKELRGYIKNVSGGVIYGMHKGDFLREHLDVLLGAKIPYTIK